MNTLGNILNITTDVIFVMLSVLNPYACVSAPENNRKHITICIEGATTTSAERTPCEYITTETIGPCTRIFSTWSHLCLPRYEQTLSSGLIGSRCV